MIKYKVFLSCPTSFETKWLQSYVDLIKSFNAEVLYWNRYDIYDEYMLNQANCLVLVSPENKFSHNIKHLPRGCQTEVEEALMQGLPIYLLYTTTEGVSRVYETTINKDGMLSGIGGTSSTIVVKINNFNKAIAKTVKDAQLNPGREMALDGMKPRIILDTLPVGMEEWKKYHEMGIHIVDSLSFDGAGKMSINYDKRILLMQ